MTCTTIGKPQARSLLKPPAQGVVSTFDMGVAPGLTVAMLAPPRAPRRRVAVAAATGSPAGSVPHSKRALGEVNARVESRTQPHRKYSDTAIICRIDPLTARREAPCEQERQRDSSGHGQYHGHRL